MLYKFYFWPVLWNKTFFIDFYASFILCAVRWQASKDSRNLFRRKKCSKNCGLFTSFGLNWMQWFSYFFSRLKKVFSRLKGVINDFIFQFKQQQNEKIKITFLFILFVFKAELEKTAKKAVKICCKHILRFLDKKFNFLPIANNEKLMFLPSNKKVYKKEWFPQASLLLPIHQYYTRVLLFGPAW